MSLLLDALNKADRERKRNEASPGLHSLHEEAPAASPRKKVLIGVAASIALFFGAFAATYWFRQGTTPPQATQSPNNNSTAKAAQSTPTIASTSAKKASAITNGEQTASAPTTTEDINTADDNVATLYQQNMATQTAVAPSSTADAPTNSDQTPSAPSSITQFSNIPDLHDLPSQILVSIPSLNYSEHNYNALGGSVKINGTIYRANEQIAPGLVIDKILEDGVILHVNNYAFKMRALNSWVNM